MSASYGNFRQFNILHRIHVFMSSQSSSRVLTSPESSKRCSRAILALARSFNIHTFREPHLSCVIPHLRNLTFCDRFSSNSFEARNEFLIIIVHILNFTSWSRLSGHPFFGYRIELRKKLATEQRTKHVKLNKFTWHLKHISLSNFDELQEIAGLSDFQSCPVVMFIFTRNIYWATLNLNDRVQTGTKLLFLFSLERIHEPNLLWHELSSKSNIKNPEVFR